MLSRMGRKRDDGLCLGDIGFAYSQQGDDKTACLLRSGDSTVAVKWVPHDEAYELRETGKSYTRTGNSQEALKSFDQALTLARAIKEPMLEAKIFDGLLVLYRSQQPALATYFGKQAVSLLQQMRSSMKGMESGLTSTFLTSNSDVYHHLSDVLIVQGRLSEGPGSAGIAQEPGVFRVCAQQPA